jgi:hypothetical protein
MKFAVPRRVKIIAASVLGIYSIVFTAAGYGLGHLF